MYNLHDATVHQEKAGRTAQKGTPELGYINKVENRSVNARSMCAYKAAPLERHALLCQLFI